MVSFSYNKGSSFNRSFSFSSSKIPTWNGLKTPGVMALLLTNVATIFIAVIFRWELADLLWTYWMQSVIIGVFQYFKIRNLKNFSTKNFKINGQPVEATEKTKRYVANFFLLHYGFFHFIYSIFLSNGYSTNIFVLLPISLLFFFNHKYSYQLNKEADAQRRQNIGVVMFAPYARIIPMHLTIILGGAFLGSASTMVLILFMGLKTIADVISHTIEHLKANKPTLDTYTP